MDKSRQQTILDAKYEGRVVSLYHNKWSIDEIAKSTGLSHEQIMTILKTYKLQE